MWGCSASLRFGSAEFVEAALLPQRLEAGALLAIKVLGAEDATLDLAGGGLRPGLAPAAAATLTVTVDQLLALGCGRSDAPTIADLPLKGDRAAVADMLAVAGITP
jgi:hypothetical protein